MPYIRHTKSYLHMGHNCSSTARVCTHYAALLRSFTDNLTLCFSGGVITGAENGTVFRVAHDDLQPLQPLHTSVCVPRAAEARPARLRLPTASASSHAQMIGGRLDHNQGIVLSGCPNT